MDRRRAAAEPQRLGGRTRLALRVDPHRATRSIEQPRRIARRLGAVATARTRDTERADQPEEAQALEVLARHHRERLEPEHVRADEDRDERIPPRRVIRDPQRRVLARGRPDLVEAMHHHRRERRADARDDTTREPSREPRPAMARDHRATHASTSDAASGLVSLGSGASGLLRAHRARTSSTSLRIVDVDARAPMLSHPRARITRPMSA